MLLVLLLLLRLLLIDRLLIEDERDVTEEDSAAVPVVEEVKEFKEGVEELSEVVEDAREEELEEAEEAEGTGFVYEDVRPYRMPMYLESSIWFSKNDFFILKKVALVRRESLPAWCCGPILSISRSSASSFSPPFRFLQLFIKYLMS